MMRFLSDMSYREKSIFAEFTTEIITIVYFISAILGLPDNTSIIGFALIPIVAKTIGIAIVLNIVTAILLGISGKEEIEDERDHKLNAVANSIAYYILTISVILILCLIMGSSGSEYFLNPGFIKIFGLSNLEPIHTIVMLFAALSFASISKSVTQLYLYKWGKI